MRRHLATLALIAPARAVAVDATVNVKAVVDNIHTISTVTLVVLHAVFVVSAVGVDWALRPQNTHGRAFGPAKSKMQPRDLPARATTLCKTNKAHKRRTKSTAASMALTGGLLGTLVLAAQVGPAYSGYSCTSHADCAYSGCNDQTCADCWSSRSYCVNGFWDYSRCNKDNGVWDAVCVSILARAYTSACTYASSCTYNRGMYIYT